MEVTAMDQFFLQISELNRAGWSLQIFPESNVKTMPAVRAAVIWSREDAKSSLLAEESPTYPLIDWINLFAPEIELRNAVAKMHAWVFPIPPFGDLPRAK